MMVIPDHSTRVETMNVATFDGEALAYLRGWIQRNGHSLPRLVLDRVRLEPGRAFVLVIEGIPLVSQFPGSDWDFEGWADGSPVPMLGGERWSLDGRVRWF